MEIIFLQLFSIAHQKIFSECALPETEMNSSKQEKIICIQPLYHANRDQPAISS